MGSVLAIPATVIIPVALVAPAADAAAAEVGQGFTVSPSDLAASIGAVVTYNAATRVATLNPNANLAANTEYRVTLTGGATAIRDRAGAPLATTSWTFTTAPAAVNPPPTVTAQTPAPNATGVAVGINATATFSEPVNGVNGTTVQLRRVSTNALIGAAVTFNATTRVVTLNPNANLAANVQYRVTLTGGATAIRDLAGAPLATTSWTFTTAAANPPPTVTARTPAINATGVSRTINATATFSEAVNGVSGTTVQLRRVSTNALIGAVVTYNATTRVVTLNPNATLAANVQYRVTLTGGATAIRDLAGAPLATTSWTFTTGP